MTRHEELLERYEDSIFALMMESVAQEEGSKLEAYNQELLADPNCAISEETDAKMVKAIRNCFAKQQRKLSQRRLLRALHVAATVAAICVLLGSLAFAFSEEVQIKTRNLIIAITDGYTDFQMETLEETALREAAEGKRVLFFDHLDIGWLPEGFQPTKTALNQFVLYQDASGEYIQVSFADAVSTIQLDTEDATVTEAVIHELPAILVEKNGHTTIMLTDLDGGYFYMVMASDGVGREAAVKVAENLILF